MSAEPIEWDVLEDEAAWDEWAARHEARIREKAAQLAASASPVQPTDVRTTKRVRAMLDVTFHGDYVPVDDIPTRLAAWIDAGLNDREDCRGWTLTVSAVSVESGDPDGYDS